MIARSLEPSAPPCLRSNIPFTLPARPWTTLTASLVLSSERPVVRAASPKAQQQVLAVIPLSGGRNAVAKAARQGRAATDVLVQIPCTPATCAQLLSLRRKLLADLDSLLSRITFGPPGD